MNLPFGPGKWQKGGDFDVKVSNNRVKPLKMPPRGRIIPYCVQGMHEELFLSVGHPINNYSHFYAGFAIFDHFGPFLTIFEPNLVILAQNPYFPHCDFMDFSSKKKS